MKILVMTPYAPFPPNSGGRMRILDELRFLSRRHQLTLVSFYQLEQEYPARTALEAFCERVYYFPRPTHPSDKDKRSMRSIEDLFQWHTIPDMESVLAELQAQLFDLVILHHIYMAQYARLFEAPAVLVEQNIESNLFEQHAQLVGAGKERAFRRARQMLLRQHETAMWNQFHLRVVLSEHDRQEMARRCTVGRTIVIENGIDTREFPLLERPTSRTLLFMGSLDFYPNIDAVSFLCETLLPRIWEQDPTLSLVIAGRRPPKLLQNLSAGSRIQVIADPPDMQAIAKQCALTLVPMRIGSGTHIKILQALAFGLPVVTTALGCQGLRVQNGREVLIADDPAAFANAVLRVLNEPGLAEQLRQAGRTLVETHYEATGLLNKYEEALITFAYEYSRH